MAEGGARNISKVFQKTVTRTKEKVLQNLGKADRTKDDQFEQHETNFNEQLVTAYKLQKVLKTYSERLKDMSLASTSLYRTMKEVYSADWLGYTDFCAAYEEIVGTWDGYLSHVDELTVTPLNNYIALFPKYKEKMAKRKRKLTDYDSARHNHDSVSNAKKMDDNKISKALEELNETKHIYETINSSIIEELSSFHKSRVHVLSSAFHGLIGAEIDFHKNSIMVKKVMDIAVEKLKEDADKFRVPCADDNSDTPQRSQSVDEDQRYIDLDFKVAHRMLVPQHKLRSSLKNQSANNDVVTGGTTPPHLEGDKSEPTAEDQPTTPGDSPQHGTPKLKPMTSPAVPAPTYQNVIAERNRKSGTLDSDNPPPGGFERPSTNGDSNEEELEKPEEEKDKANIDSPKEPSSPPASTPEITKVIALGEKEVPIILSTPNSEEAPTNNSTHEGPTKVAESTGRDDGEAYDIPVPKHQGVVPTNRVLFRVKATHNYVGEDTDELTFEAGEVITVVPFDDPDDQDEGWLMGVKESSRERGVFPENFTTRIE